MNLVHRRAGIAAVLLVATALAACDADFVTNSTRVEGSGVLETARYELPSEFDAISLLSEGNVSVVFGEAPLVTITTDDNLLQYLNARSDGSTLFLEVESDIDIDPSGTVVWEVVTTSLQAVTLMGAGDILIPPVTADSFRVTLTGAGSINIEEIQATELDVTISGAGTVSAEGTVDSQEIHIPGAGDYEGLGVISTSADVDVTGAGDATVFVTGALNAAVTGVGSVFYGGDPVVTQAVSGLGSVTAID